MGWIRHTVVEVKVVNLTSLIVMVEASSDNKKYFVVNNMESFSDLDYFKKSLFRSEDPKQFRLEMSHQPLLTDDDQATTGASEMLTDFDYQSADAMDDVRPYIATIQEAQALGAIRTMLKKSNKQGSWLSSYLSNLT